MGSSVKNVLTVGAALIVPYAAPVVANAIGVSGAIATATGSAAVGSTVGSALTGAVLGGVTAQATGGDFERGAIGGAVGGGLSGFSQGVAAGSGANTPQGGGAPPNVRGVGPDAAQAARGTASGSTLARSPVPGTDTSITGNPMSTPPPTQSQVAQSQVAQDLGLSAGSTPGSVPAGTEAVSGGSRFMEAIRSVPGEVAQRFSDPEVLADFTLRAAGIVAQTYITGQAVPDSDETLPEIDETRPEIRDLDADERRLLDAQLQDLNELRNRNEELFRQRLESAQDILGEARYFDPEVFGMDAYADVQRREGLRQREAARDAALSPGRAGLSAEDVRRSQLGGAIGAQTAYTQAADSAQQQRLRTYQAGLSALPDPGQFSTINESSTMAGMINQARTSRRETENQIRQDRQLQQEERRRQQAGFGEIFESLSEPFMRA